MEDVTSLVWSQDESARCVRRFAARCVFWEMSLLFRSLVSLLLLSLAGCGGGADCTGPQFTDAQLCSLKCGESTYDQAKALLGAPSASGSQFLDYRATCAGGSELLAITLTFDSANRLSKVGRLAVGARFSGGSLPSCLAACQ